MTQHCEGFDLIEAPAGRHLRICGGCAKRVIECSSCDAMLVAGPHVKESGWTWYGTIGGPLGSTVDGNACPDCSRGRH